MASGSYPPIGQAVDRTLLHPCVSPPFIRKVAAAVDEAERGAGIAPPVPGVPFGPCAGDGSRRCLRGSLDSPL